MEAKKYELKVETIEALFNYLASRPYQEVIGYINQIQKEIQEQRDNK